ncbi:hypothetical protein V6N11_080570 [Hibiscus sabdariffa]|uniref:Uncharacterized protein n=1 Tax=Hibiscus sabdariffa TaxID=183260 RepID=A0ABR2R8J6_9ROSI
MMIFLLRVAVFEDVYVVKKDCCCDADEDSFYGTLSQGVRLTGDNEIDSPTMNGCEASSIHKDMQRDYSKENTMVPNLVSLEVVTSSRIERLWEGNRRMDDRVMDISDIDKICSYEEDMRLVARPAVLERGVDIIQVTNEMLNDAHALSSGSAAAVEGKLRVGPR